MSRGGQLIRQWQLLRALQNHRHGICVDDLAAQMGYGRRTIERDICVLKEVNFPISSELRDFGKKFWKSTLAKLTGLPLKFITSLVYRADIALLPYVRRKTILPVCGAGYNTLAKIASADLVQMESDLEAYFQRTQGKPWKNYKAVIVLKGLVTGAQALPVIMDK